MHLAMVRAGFGPGRSTPVRENGDMECTDRSARTNWVLRGAGLAGGLHLALFLFLAEPSTSFADTAARAVREGAYSEWIPASVLTAPETLVQGTMVEITSLELLT